MHFKTTVGGRTYRFDSLAAVLARASPARSGDQLAGVAAASAQERVAARTVLADLPLAVFLEEPVVPYESDEVTRLIVDTHDAAAFAPVSHLTVGAFRDASGSAPRSRSSCSANGPASARPTASAST